MMREGEKFRLALGLLVEASVSHAFQRHAELQAAARAHPRAGLSWRDLARGDELRVIDAALAYDLLLGEAQSDPDGGGGPGGDGDGRASHGWHGGDGWHEGGGWHGSAPIGHA